MSKAGGLAAAVVVAALVGSAPAVAAGGSVQVIAEDTTWTREQSPVVIGVVRVEPGVTLTIEPGVVVDAEPAGSILIAGALRAQGTESEPIRFTADGSWKGIRLLDSEGPRPPSAIDHVHIERASTGLLMGRDAVPVTDSTFTNNSGGLVVINPARTVTFTGNEFYSNGQAFGGLTTGTIGLYGNDFWDNRITLSFEAQDVYSCATDHGHFDVHYNDILRGPDDDWSSGDVRTSFGSAETNMVVDASQNWWGSTDPEDIAARIWSERSGFDMYGRVIWRDPATTPQTAAQPPGAVGDPEPDPEESYDYEYRVHIERPQWGACVPEGSVRRIVATLADGPIGEVPAEVPVWLRKGIESCKLYDGRRFVPAECDEISYFFVDVKDDRMVLRFRRPLRPGRYFVAIGDSDEDYSAFRVFDDDR